MRSLLFTAGLVALMAGFALPAQAQNYPWCATYTGSAGGSQNCGFTSFEQCMATVRGMGGFCDQNTQYVPPAGARRR
jgi:hypothetical protein